MNKRLLLLFSVFIIIGRSLFAQSNVDTLEKAKNLRNENKFKEAFALMEKYRANHPNDLNAAWLSGQTAFWMKHYKTAEKEYERAIQIAPHNADLLLDYDMVLFNSGDLKKAEPLLWTFYTWDPTNTAVLLSLAKISFWHGNYNDAEWFIQKVLASDPKNKNAIAIQDEILAAKSPWGEINIAHSSDDQPLQNTAPSISGGIYSSALFSPHFDFQLPTFVTDSSNKNAWWFQVGNKSIFSKQNLDISIDLGLLKNPSSTSVFTTGNLLINETLIKHFIFSLQAERKPYFYTLSSLNTTVTDNHYSVSVAWNDPEGWNARTAYDIDNFNDNNSIATFSAWVMSPPLKVSIFEFHAGYGFNYSNTQQNRYELKSLTYAFDSISKNYFWDSTLNKSVQKYYYSPVITGIYNPYFTPDKQTINSVIASINIHPTKTLNIGIKADYGFSAVAQCPYLYLDNEGNIAIGYFKQNYSPYDIGINVTWKLAKKINLKAEYVHSKTNFYNSNYLGIGLRMSFWNENK
jgi:tetratricopeptide (TPR) repeat protein